eukprot:32833-Chlamydomonas_euryale.AAC.1
MIVPQARARVRVAGSGPMKRIPVLSAAIVLQDGRDKSRGCRLQVISQRLPCSAECAPSETGALRGSPVQACPSWVLSL